MNNQEGLKPELVRSEEEVRLASLMVESQNGNSESYRKLLLELNAMLEKYATNAVRRSNPNGDSSVALDVVQEVLMAIHNKRHTYDPTQRFLPWVFGIARHKFIDWQRKHFNERKWLDFDFEVNEVIAPEVSQDSNGGLQSLLKKLNPKQREVIQLTKIQGLSISEVATQTGLTEANIKVLTHRAVSALKKMVEDGHE